MRRWPKRSTKTECDQVREMLSPYLDNELKSAEQARVKSHLQSCQSCQEEYNSLRQTSNLLRQLPEVQPRRSFRITESEAARKTRFDRLRVLFSVTVTVALILILILLGDRLHYFDISPSIQCQRHYLQG